MQNHLSAAAVRVTSRKGNPQWIKGGKSPNSLGIKIGHSKESKAGLIRAGIERFLRARMSAQALNTMYNELDTRDRLTLLVNLLPYAVSKTNPASELERLTESQLDALYQHTMHVIKAGHKTLNTKAGSMEPTAD